MGEAILKLLEDGPGTPREIAAELNIEPRRATNLMWHLKKAGKIVVLQTIREFDIGRPARMYGLA